MYVIIKVEARPHYRLFVQFDDGLSGEVDLSQRLFGPMFEPLRDSTLFVKVTTDEFGAVCWPNGADIAPDAIHEQLAARVVG